MLEPELTTREATATRSPRAAPESSLHPLHPKTSTRRDEDPVQPKKKKKKKYKALTLQGKQSQSFGGITGGSCRRSTTTPKTCPRAVLLKVWSLDQHSWRLVRKAHSRPSAQPHQPGDHEAVGGERLVGSRGAGQYSVF